MDVAGGLGMADGGLRALFKAKLPHFDWTHIETGSIAQGVPDANACYNGNEFWIEYKLTKTDRVAFRNLQPQWIHRRVRHGGKVWIAARKKHDGGARLGKPMDTLFLFHGSRVLDIVQHGLHLSLTAGIWYNGPGCWDWQEIGETLISPYPRFQLAE